MPDRVRVLVLGGGIHGAGVLHDMATREWRDIHLVEKVHLGHGTSSRSTKLIHGGLRYLRQIRDFGLVTEALRERRLLLGLLPDLVKPVEFLLPVMREGGVPRWMIKAGLMLYDGLAGKARIQPHRLLSPGELASHAPCLDQSTVKVAYSFWDAQTDDMALVRRVVASAKKLGATVTERAEVLRLRATADGYDVDVRQADGAVKTVSALYVVNALGPWANRLLEASDIPPTHRALNNKGVHLLVRDLGLKTGFFLQSPEDGRIFFLLPWEGHTLIGTTEELFSGNPDDLTVRDDEVEYLLSRCNRFLNDPLSRADIQAVFAGLRWLAVESGESLTETSRHYVVGERQSHRGLLMTLYGGKLTTYRNLSATIGDRITSHFGEFRASRTHLADFWAAASEVPSARPPVVARFDPLPEVAAASMGPV